MPQATASRAEHSRLGTALGTPPSPMRQWLLLLAALVGAALPLPLHQSPLREPLQHGKQARPEERIGYSVPADLRAPMQLPRPHFGLVDDYGIRPKQPHFRSHATQAQPAWLHHAGKSKRDELDRSEYYDDNRL